MIEYGLGGRKLSRDRGVDRVKSLVELGGGCLKVGLVRDTSAIGVNERRDVCSHEMFFNSLKELPTD